MQGTRELSSRKTQSTQSTNTQWSIVQTSGINREVDGFCRVTGLICSATEDRGRIKWIGEVLQKRNT